MTKTDDYIAGLFRHEFKLLRAKIAVGVLQRPEDSYMWRQIEDAAKVYAGSNYRRFLDRMKATELGPSE